MSEQNEWENSYFDESNDAFLSGDNKDTIPSHAPDVQGEQDLQPVQAQKKKRGALFWFGSLSAVVLLVVTFGGVIYWLTQPSVEEQAFISGHYPVVETHNTVADPAVVPAVADSNIKHDSEAIAALTGTEKTEPTKTKVVAEAETKPKPRPNSIPLQKTAPVVPITRIPRKHAETNTQPKAHEPDPVQKPTIASNRLTEIPVAPSTAMKEKAEYVVQVYSSPSKQDASEWLQELRERNISGGYIVEQKIRGEQWYRVRFGSFATKNAAEEEAMRLGFRQPWVARIR